MSDVLAISLHSMQQEMARVERVSMNMANATTPGYKREVAVSLPVGGTAFGDAMRNAEASMASPLASPPEGLANASFLVRPDLRPGTLKPTGQKLDVALAMPGYFEVSTDAGPAYTRQGNWQLDGRGRLVTAQGHPVMGLGGEIVLSRPNPVIDSNGQVFEASAQGEATATPVAQLKVLQFDNHAELRRMGDGLLMSEQQPSQVPDVELQVRQGFLENSNVSSMQEMAQLIQAMRHFESMQRVALGYDDMIGSAVRKLGELS